MCKKKPNGSREEDEIEKSVQREGQTDRWTMADQKSSPELAEKFTRALTLS